jgi:hypothetical protein
MRHFFHKDILLYSIEARVSTRSSMFPGCDTAASAVMGVHMDSIGSEAASSESKEDILRD